MAQAAAAAPAGPKPFNEIIKTVDEMVKSKQYTNDQIDSFIQSNGIDPDSFAPKRRDYEAAQKQYQQGVEQAKKAGTPPPPEPHVDYPPTGGAGGVGGGGIPGTGNDPGQPWFEGPGSVAQQAYKNIGPQFQRGWEMVKGGAQQFAQHPLDTAHQVVEGAVKGAVDTGAGIVREGARKILPEGVFQAIDQYGNPNEETRQSGVRASEQAQAVGEHLNPYWQGIRHGNLEPLKQRISEDPMGVPLDIATVLTGGEGVAARIPSIARAGPVARAIGPVATRRINTVLRTPERVTHALNPATWAEGAISKAISPVETDPNVAREARIMDREGVPLTAGQRTGSERLRYMEEQQGGATTTGMTRQAAQEFTRATLRRIGVDADNAGPQILRPAYQALGRRFDALERSNRLIIDPTLERDLRQALTDYTNNVPANQTVPFVENYVNEVLNAANQPGTVSISGRGYQKSLSDLRRRVRNENRPEVKEALIDVIGAMDAAMERSIAAHNPTDLGAWRELRNQYRDYLVIEKAVTQSGKTADMGYITPQALRAATVNMHGRRNYAHGQGDFAEMARAGGVTMRPLPQSGTAPREATYGSPTGAIVGGVTGWGLGQMTQGMGELGAMIGTTVGGLTGNAAARTAGRLMMNPAVQGYLSNQLSRHVMPALTRARQAALAARLLQQDDEGGRRAE